MPGEEEEEEVSKEEIGTGRQSSSYLFIRQIDAGQEGEKKKGPISKLFSKNSTA